MLSSTGTTTSYQGQTYTVYSTGYPGIGMIIGFSDGESSCGGYYYEGDIGQNNGSYYGAGCSVGTSTNVGAQVQVALVKTGQPSAGMLSGLTIAQALPGVTYAASARTAAVTYPAYTVSFTTPPVQIINASCTTPDVSIPLGTFPTTGFTAIGRTTTTANFSISLNNCPAGMNSIKYRIDPTTTVLNSSQSVVALDSTSSATGVGVQLLNSAGSAAFPLSSLQTFSGYSSSTGGSYTIPLAARYYQTSATVTPGPANTSMTVTMQYQ